MHMKLQIKEVRNRVTTYNNEFLQIVLNTDLDGVKSKVVIEAYLRGVKPDVIAKLAKNYADTYKVTLKEVMKFVLERRLKLEAELYQAREEPRRDKNPRQPAKQEPKEEPKKFGLSYPQKTRLPTAEWLKTVRYKIFCQELGHLAKNYLHINMNNQTRSPVTSRVKEEKIHLVESRSECIPEFVNSAEHKSELMMIPLKIGVEKQEIQAMVDPGASISSAYQAHAYI